MERGRNFLVRAAFAAEQNLSAFDVREIRLQQLLG